jgi:hypothetical protein
MSSTVKFFVELEMRIGVLLDAKVIFLTMYILYPLTKLQETTALCPFSLRLLVAKLLTEIRLFTHSLKA